MPVQRPFGSAREAVAYRRQRYRLGTQYLLDLRERSIVRRALRLLPSGPRRVLDVPCGYGRLLGEAAVPSTTAFGADVSHAQAVLGREHAPTLVADLLDGLPFPDRWFDIVLCVRLFHHLESSERVRALEELVRVSRSFVLLSYYRRHPVWSWHRRLQESVRHRARISVMADGDLGALSASRGLSVIARWDPAGLIHAHRFVLLARSPSS